jgi:hypothetical protein
MCVLCVCVCVLNVLLVLIFFLINSGGSFPHLLFIESKVKDHIYKVLLGIPRQRYRLEGGVCRAAESQVAEAQL